ncbi:MAG: ComEC/Rec2 family competence protein, partial [Acidimicrobiia bacterium]
MRLLVPAGAGWLAAVLLVAHRPLVGVLTAAVALTLSLVCALALLRSAIRTQVGWAAVGVLVVVAGMGLAAGLQVEGLRAGPVTGLAAESASVGVKLKIDGDPSVRRSPGSRRPPYVVVKATIEEVRARGTVTRVRTPVFVIGSAQWEQVRFGQRVDANGRLEAVERGSDVAAMLSIRSAPRIVDQPPWWLRAAEKVRAGLRESVAGQPDDV